MECWKIVRKCVNFLFCWRRTLLLRTVLVVKFIRDTYIWVPFTFSLVHCFQKMCVLCVHSHEWSFRFSLRFTRKTYRQCSEWQKSKKNAPNRNLDVIKIVKQWSSLCLLLLNACHSFLYSRSKDFNGFFSLSLSWAHVYYEKFFCSTYLVINRFWSLQSFVPKLSILLNSMLACKPLCAVFAFFCYQNSHSLYFDFNR